MGGITGASIGATIAGAALNMPQPMADLACKGRSTSPRRGGRPSSNTVSSGASCSRANTPTAPVKPTQIDSPGQQNPNKDHSRAGRSTSPRFTGDKKQSHKIQQFAEINKRLMYQIDRMQGKHNHELQQANRISDNTNKHLDAVKAEIPKMPERHQDAIDRVRSQSRARAQTSETDVTKSVTLQDEN